MEYAIISLYEFATIAVPAAIVCFVTWLYSSRQEGKTWIALVIAWIVYLYGLLHYTGAGTLYDAFNYGLEIRPDRINLIPFSDTEPMMILNVLNVILFVPLGILAPLLMPKRTTLWKVLLLGLAVSLCIELSQLLNIRATDVDDLIMNTLGTLVGYVIYCLLPARWRRSARRQAASGIVMGCLVAAFAGRFLLFGELYAASVLFGF